MLTYGTLGCVPRCSCQALNRAPPFPHLQQLLDPQPAHPQQRRSQQHHAPQWGTQQLQQQKCQGRQLLHPCPWWWQQLWLQQKGQLLQVWGLAAPQLPSQQEQPQVALHRCHLSAALPRLELQLVTSTAAGLAMGQVAWAPSHPFQALVLGPLCPTT